MYLQRITSWTTAIFTTIDYSLLADWSSGSEPAGCGRRAGSEEGSVAGSVDGSRVVAGSVAVWSLPAPQSERSCPRMTRTRSSMARPRSDRHQRNTGKQRGSRGEELLA